LIGRGFVISAADFDFVIFNINIEASTIIRGELFPKLYDQLNCIKAAVFESWPSQFLVVSNFSAQCICGVFFSQCILLPQFTISTPHLQSVGFFFDLFKIMFPS
jgi:hypothetical protein